MVLSQINQIITDTKESLWIKSNMALALKTDSELELYFKQNKQAFELLLKDTKQKISGTHQGLIETSDSNNTLAKLLLTYSSVLRPHCIAFVITDMYNRRVGFTFTTDKSKLSDFGYKRFIFGKDLGNGWYIFRGKL